MVARVGSVGIIRSVSSLESNAVDRPVSAARRERVNLFWVRRARSLMPMQYGSRDHCAYFCVFDMFVTLSRDCHDHGCEFWKNSGSFTSNRFWSVPIQFLKRLR